MATTSHSSFSSDALSTRRPILPNLDCYQGHEPKDMVPINANLGGFRNWLHVCMQLTKLT